MTLNTKSIQMEQDVFVVMLIVLIVLLMRMILHALLVQWVIINKLIMMVKIHAFHVTFNHVVIVMLTKITVQLVFQDIF